MNLEKKFRTLACRLVTARDGYHRVFSHKKKFKQFAFDSYENVRRQSVQKLQSILNHAYNSSSYYHELLETICFDSFKSNPLENLQQIPFLTKKIIEENKHRMVSSKFSLKALELSYTGGSSGTPTSFFRNWRCSAVRKGRQLGILELCGYYLGDRCGSIWGVRDDLLDLSGKQTFKTKFRKFASGKETLYCTIMNEETMEGYYERLRLFKPSVLYGYPNAMSNFATYLKSKSKSISVKTIICTAERLTPSQRRLLQDVFSGEVFNLYCTREHGCIGFECREHNGFHLDAGSVHLEIVKNGHPAKRGETGEIVTTDLLNYGMPFLRYKIGDIGSLSKNQCTCGCNLPLLKNLDGRVSDTLYKTDGSNVAGIMLSDMFRDDPTIANMQIVQEDLNEIHIFIEVKDRFLEKDKERVINETRKYMGKDVKLKIMVVERIPRNPNSGKFQEVICKIKNPR